MRLNLHARIEIAAVALLLLGSCDGPGLSDKQRDEVGDIAADGNVSQEEFSSLKNRVDLIEQRLNM